MKDNASEKTKATAGKQPQKLSGPAPAAPGNQAMLRHLRNGQLRAKLKVGGSEDRAERQADRIAEATLQGSGRSPCACGDCASCRSAASVGSTSASAARRDSFGSSPGQALDTATRSYFETRMGTGLGGVRVHDSPDIASRAASIGARAYAIGNDIGFARGEFAPASGEGRRLLAHELGHVVSADSGEGIVRRQVPETGPSDAGGAAMPDRSGPLQSGHDDAFDPCSVEAGSLTNYALLAELHGTAAYLRGHTRGQDRFFDYANLMRRLVSERARRVGMGHHWLVGDQPDFPSQLYSMQHSEDGTLTITMVNAGTLSGAATPVAGAVMRPEQFNAFLDRNGVERIDVAEFYRRMAEIDNDEQLNLLPPRAEPEARRPGIPDFLFGEAPLGPPGPSTFSVLGPSGLAASPFDLAARGNLTRNVYSPNVTMTSARSRSSAETQWRGGLFETSLGSGSYADMFRYRDLNRVVDNFNVFDFGTRGTLSEATSVTHSASGTDSEGNAQYRNKFARMTGGDERGNFNIALGRLNAAYETTMTARDLNERNTLAVPDDHVGRVQAQAEWLVINRPERVAPLLDALLADAPITRGDTAYASWNQVTQARASGALADADFRALLVDLAPGARGRVRGVGMMLAEVMEMQRIRAATNAFGPGEFNAIAPPEVLQVRRLMATGVAEADAIGMVARGSAVRGMAMGGGMTAALDALVFAHSGFDPETGRALALGFVPQVGASGVGAYGQAQWNARLGGNVLTEAMASGGTSAVARGAAVRIGGAGAFGGPLATLATWGTMGLEEAAGTRDYIDIDYAALGGRSFVAGGIAAMAGEAGLLGTVAICSAAGTEVPILGNIVGAVIGVGVYFTVDYLWGDDIEASIRDASGENGCVGR